MLFGAGFLVTPEEAAALGLGRVDGLDAHIRPYRNGRDLTQTPRGVLVIDLFGLDGRRGRASGSRRCTSMSCGGEARP